MIRDPLLPIAEGTGSARELVLLPVLSCRFSISNNFSDLSMPLLSPRFRACRPAAFTSPPPYEPTGHVFDRIFFFCFRAVGGCVDARLSIINCASRISKRVRPTKSQPDRSANPARGERAAASAVRNRHKTDQRRLDRRSGSRKVRQSPCHRNAESLDHVLQCHPAQRQG